MKEQGFKPSDRLPGHWTKARSLTGARDYCAGAGIHFGKQEVVCRWEFGSWVDPGWNQSIRTRLVYEFASRIQDWGWTIKQLKVLNPAGVLLLGENNLKSLRVSPAMREEPPESREPYCYIGRTSLDAVNLELASELKVYCAVNDIQQQASESDE